MEYGSLSFIDFNDPSLSQFDESLSLRPLFNLIRDTVDKLAPSDETSSQSERVLLIIDDISTIEWTGCPTEEISRFCRALSAFCTKVRRPFLCPSFSFLRACTLPLSC